MPKSNRSPAPADFNDKHLLWWVLKASGGFADIFYDLKLIGAPEWVEPALKKKSNS